MMCQDAPACSVNRETTVHEKHKLRVLLRAMRPFAKAHPLAHSMLPPCYASDLPCRYLTVTVHGHWQQHTPVIALSTKSVWLYDCMLSHTGEAGLSSRRACI
jgi:hypothetical protein